MKLKVSILFTVLSLCILTSCAESQKKASFFDGKVVVENSFVENGNSYLSFDLCCEGSVYKIEFFDPKEENFESRSLMPPHKTTIMASKEKIVMQEPNAECYLLKVTRNGEPEAQILLNQ